MIWIKFCFFDQDHNIFDLQIKIKIVDFWSKSKNKTRFFGPDQKQKSSYLIQIKKILGIFDPDHDFFMIQTMGSWTFRSFRLIHDLPTVKVFLNEMRGKGSKREAAQSKQQQRMSELRSTVLKQRVAKKSRRWSVKINYK